MDIEQNKNTNPDSNISKTGYRALFVLKKLLKNSYTREELAQICKENPVINKDLSVDTVTYTINTLKASGCIISRPTKRIDNKYILRYHPFNTLLKKEHIEALQELRESIATLGDWELLIYLNNLFAKIARIAPDEKTRNLLLYKNPLRGVDYKILNELMVCTKRTTEHINITYDSPENGFEDLYFSPQYLTYENDKLYIWGHVKKYNQISYLRVDRIKRVNMVTFTMFEDGRKNKKDILFTVLFKLKGYSALMYSDNEHERIVKTAFDDDYQLLIEAKVTNDFNFYQRLLSFGTDCYIVSPDSVREEYLQKLKNIKAVYLDE